MALDPTARESNFKDSMKKYFVENLNTTEGIPILFDKGLATPPITKNKTNVKWVSINFGKLLRDTVSEAEVIIFPCTRADTEGFRLAQLTDTVLGYLSDVDSTTGMKSIPFYRSRSEGAWTKIGGILIIPPVSESTQSYLPDGTKYKMLTVRCKFASKV